VGTLIRLFFFLRMNKERSLPAKERESSKSCLDDGFV
jgi:hypothetical protein